MPTYIPFLRVSTNQQTNDRQLADISARAQREGWELASPIAETVSGRKRNAQRAGLTKLLETVRRRDTVVVTEVSRLGRSPGEVLRVLEQLTEQGVAVFALNFGISTMTPDWKPNPLAQFIFLLLAEVARLELEFLSERVHSGLASARKRGRIGGRPEGATKASDRLLTDHSDVVKALEANLSIREVANLTKKSPTTVNKVSKALLAKKAVPSELGQVA